MTLEIIERIESVEKAYADGYITSQELLDFYTEIELEAALVDADSIRVKVAKPTGDLVPA